MKNKILKIENRLFLVKLLGSSIGYTLITLWLNNIRITAPIWFVWLLIIIQFTLYFSIFVSSYQRSISLGLNKNFALALFLILTVLGRVNDWELIVIPLLIVVMLILSAKNKNVSEKGLTVKPDITEDNLTELTQSAYKNGYVHVSVFTPHNQLARITIRVERSKGFNRVEVDTYGCNWNISEIGQKNFMQLSKDFPEDIENPYCGKTTMRVHVKCDDEKMWGVGLWLIYMFKILEKDENLKEMKLL